jgi:hypothetical protein
MPLYSAFKKLSPGEYNATATVPAEGELAGDDWRRRWLRGLAGDLRLCRADGVEDGLVFIGYMLS